MSASSNSRITRAGLPAAITPGGIDAATTLPAPITESAPITTPFRIRTRSPTNTFGPSSTCPIAGLPPGPTPRGKLVEVAVVDADPRAEQRAGPDQDARSLALDEEVVVEHRAIAELDHRFGRGCLDVAIAGVEAIGVPPAEPDVVTDHDPTVAAQQQRLVQKPASSRARATATIVRRLPQR